VKKLILAISLFLFIAPVASLAQDDPHAADRESLLVILGGIEDALNARDMQGALKHLDDNVIITYHDATVTQGPDAAMAYYNRMMEGSAAIVTEFNTVASVGAPAVFHGDTATAFGTTTDKYVLTAGLEIDLDANWSMTARKNDGEWKVIALHFSTDLFDNQLLNSANKMNKMMAVGGVVVGMLLMLIIGRVRRKSANA